MKAATSILVTGATGQLGRLAIAQLRDRHPDARVAGLARNPAAAADLAAAGVDIRPGRYEDPASLEKAFAGVDRLLLVSSSEIGQRAAQHRHAIDAARSAGVGFVAYTSLLHADTSPLGLAGEHRETEAYLRASGLPAAILRNGWYMENYTGSLAGVLAHGAVIGAARDGRIAAAARADYATGAAIVVGEGPQRHAGRTYEWAGDAAFTLEEYAAEIARQAGKPITYLDLGEAGYADALRGLGLPDAYAAIIAESDAKAAQGALFDDGGALGRLLGRPTTRLADAVRAALASRP